jgi:hypothetical protein
VVIQCWNSNGRQTVTHAVYECGDALLFTMSRGPGVGGEESAQ